MTIRPARPDRASRARGPLPRLGALAGAVLLAVLAPSPAAAQQPPAPPRAAEGIDHDAVFRRGLELYDARDYLGAIAVWERLLTSLGEERAWKVLYNLALAHQSVGDATEAIPRFEAFVARADRTAPPLPPELQQRRDDAAARARAIRGSHGEVRVQPAASGAVVLARVGAREPRPAGFTVFLAPGAHEIEIGVGSPRARRVRVDVTAGGVVTLDTAIAAPPPPPAEARPAPPAPAAPGRPFPTAWVLAGGGLTALGFALPIALGSRASSLRADAEALRPGHTGYAAAKDDFEGARTAYHVSYALPAALAAATAGVVIVHVAGGGDGAARVGVAMRAGGPGLWARTGF